MTLRSTVGGGEVEYKNVIEWPNGVIIVYTFLVNAMIRRLKRKLMRQL